MRNEKMFGPSPLPVKFNADIAKKKAATKEKEQKEQAEKNAKADSPKE